MYVCINKFNKYTRVRTVHMNLFQRVITQCYNREFGMGQLGHPR